MNQADLHIELPVDDIVRSVEPGREELSGRLLVALVRAYMTPTLRYRPVTTPPVTRLADEAVGLADALRKRLRRQEPT